MATKKDRYCELVKVVRNCRDCMNSPTGRGVKLVQDPSRSEINLWSHWQNSLKAKILVIGQDWGEFPEPSTYEFWTTDKIYPSLTGKHEQIQKNKFKTDNNLQIIFREALGLDLTMKQPSLFFTNAVLCYRDKGFTGDVKESWFENCQKFCARLIDIIQPEAIVTLGCVPLRSLLYNGDLSYDREFSEINMRLKISKTLQEIVETKDQLYYKPKGSETAFKVFPMFHCGNLGTISRSIEAQIQD